MPESKHKYFRITKEVGSIPLKVTGLLAFLLLWELLVTIFGNARTLIPSPSQIMIVFYTEIRSGIWHRIVFSSFTNYIVGVSAGSLLGIACGVIVALHARIGHMTEYLVRLLRPIPPIAWIPIAIIFLGITPISASFIISIGVFWVNFFATHSAIRGVGSELIDVAVVFGHNTFFYKFTKVILPAALPSILTGIKTGLGQGWMTVVAAELFGIPGMGQRMVEAAGLLETRVVFVYMFSIALLYGVSDTLFTFIQGRLLQWNR